MNTKTKYFLFTLTFLAGILFFAGCSKSNTSVVGQWSIYKQQATANTTSVTLWDTTLNYPLGSLFTTNSDGSYDYVVPATTGNPGVTESGTWSQNGSVLTLTKSAGTSLHYNILTVSTHSMTLQRNDTFSLSPLTIIDRIYYYSR